jgi:DNA gyrase/topoisomerase IV subunit B
MSAEPPLREVATSVVQALVLYSLAEFQFGHCTTIRVEAKNRFFSISDDGRGHAIDRTVADSPYLQFIYTHFDYPFVPNAGPPAPIQLQGIGMSLINTLCSELTVTVRKSDKTLRLLFENGTLRDRQLLEQSLGGTGNMISGFVASPFSQSSDELALHSWLRRVKSSAPSLLLYFNGREVHALAQGNA